MKSLKSIIRGAVVLSIALLIVLLPISTAIANTDGPYNPASGTNVSGIGLQPWQNPENITTPGSPYTTVTLYQGHRYSNYLQGTQYGFAIPADASITGIVVNINRMSSSHNPNVVDNVVSLVKAGAIVGDNKAIPVVAWPTVLTVATYGGPTDLWGTTWIASDINSPDFGMVLAAYRDNNGNNARDALVDSMQITVYYEFTTTTTIDCGDGTPIVYGDSITCVATVSRIAGDLTPSGTVSWTTDGNGAFDPNPCTLAGADGVATCSATYTPSAIGTGSHLVTATYSGDTYFISSNASQTVNVVTRPITVTTDPLTKVYGESDHAFTYQITDGSLVFSDTFTGTLTREPGEEVGSYAILQASLALPDSYDLSYVGNFLTITKADPTCLITPYDVTYDGNPYTATGTCNGVTGEELSGLDLTETTHTGAGNYTDPWTFTDETGNYNNAIGTVNDNIAKVDAICAVTPYAVTYDGNAHTATGSCTDLYGEPLNGLDLTGTTHTDAGNYTDPWTFTDVDGNYNSQSGTVVDYIGMTDAICVVTSYDVTYDGNTHTAVGSCTGVDGEPLSGLDLNGTTHTDAGSYTDAWTFTDENENYNAQSGTVIDSIAMADPTCEITPYNVTFDGYAHTATGSCTGVDGEPLNGLDLTATIHLNPGTYTDPWSFTDETGNYNDANGTLSDSIAKADAICEISPYVVTYDGDSHTTTGFCVGVNGEPLNGLNLDGTTHVDAGSYTDTWTYTDQSGNYNDASGTVNDLIAKADATCEVSAYNVEYDREAHTASGACTGVMDEVLAGLDLTGTAHTVIGTYTNDSWTFTDLTGNYNDISGTVNDEITLRAITIVADAKSRLFDYPDPALTFQITAGSLLSGDAFSGALTREPGENIGTYAILQGTLSLPGYYVIHYMGADFNITGAIYLFPVILK